MRKLDAARVRAVVRKELHDYRRKRSIVVSMAVLPFIFLVQPTLSIFLAPAAAGRTFYRIPLLILMLIPVVMPSTLAAYAVIGEREQGTLEPLLTTPLREQELIAGKAAAIMIPSVGLSYVVYGIFLTVVRLFAKAQISSNVFHQGPMLLALFLFTPLLAGWAVVVGLVISVRASEVRVAQQLGTLASLPALGVVVLFAVGVVHPTFRAAVLFAVVLLVVDVRALRVASRVFDRERLVTGARAAGS